MRIIQTVSGCSERTVVYEIDGERRSITRPSCVSFDDIYKEIDNEVKNGEPEKHEGNEEEGKTDEEVPAVEKPALDEVAKKRTKRKV